MSAAIRTLIETITLIPRDGEAAAERWRSRVLRLLAAELGADSALAFLPLAAGTWERLATRPRARPAVVGELDRRVLAGPPAGLAARVLAGETVLQAAAPAPASPDGAAWDEVEGVTPRWLAGAVVQLGARGRGALAVWNASDPATPLVLVAAAAAFGAALENRARLGELEAESVTDDLTRVYNYRYLRLALRREVGRARRLGHPLGLLMLDVDHLKDYNERFGHLAGSQVLRGVAGVLRSSTRDIDLVTKYGGDEFLLILPHTGRAGAEVLAERLRRAIAAAAFPRLAAGELTCSIGVAVFPEGGVSPEALLAAADAALFEAKRTGRNRVCSP